MTDIAADTTTTATFEGSVAVMATYSGELETWGDVDWIRVTLQKDGVYDFFASATSAGPFGGDSWMYLYDADGVLLDDNDLMAFDVSDNSFISYTAGSTGEYFIGIRSKDDRPSAYSVVVKFYEPWSVLSEADDNPPPRDGLTLGNKGDDFITLSGSALTALGEQGDDILTGNPAAENRLSGGLGNDDLEGGPLNDRLFGEAGGDWLRGDGGDDLLYGGPGGDVLYGDSYPSGGAGNDTIFTGEGVDLVYGGNGDDIVHVDNADDRVIENPGAGIDAVATTVTYALLAGQEIEFLDVEGSLQASTVAINLTGNEFDNSMTGSDGANVLDGGGGFDTLQGLLGNDVYVLADGSDSVVDSGGIDTATSTITRSLLAGGLTVIENLTLQGGTAISGTGNNANNTLTGNNAINTLDGGLGNDRLIGLGGNDVLIGWAGKDTSTGGLGNDIFRFRTTSHSAPGANADLITDFDDYNDDRIDLSLVYGPALKYRHNLAFTAAGQVRINDIAGADVIVEVNTGGSLAADMQIRLTATALGSMAASDFIL